MKNKIERITLHFTPGAPKEDTLAVVRLGGTHIYTLSTLHRVNMLSRLLQVAKEAGFYHESTLDTPNGSYMYYEPAIPVDAVKTYDERVDQRQPTTPLEDALYAELANVDSHVADLQEEVATLQATIKSLSQEAWLIHGVAESLAGCLEDTLEKVNELRDGHARLDGIADGDMDEQLLEVLSQLEKFDTLP